MNLLSYANYVPSPNHGSELKAPRFIAVHYTAGSSLASSTKWLCDRKAKASAHLIVGKDGTVNQLVPFNVIAWHAGASEWAGLQGLNKYSIGIEIDNRGPLVKDNKGVLRAVPGGPAIEAKDAFNGAHKHGGSFRWWDKYPDAQVAKLCAVITDICREFPSIVEIVGHDDISPGRKWDPGPALEHVGFSTPRSARDFRK